MGLHGVCVCAGGPALIASVVQPLSGTGCPPSPVTGARSPAEATAIAGELAALAGEPGAGNQAVTEKRGDCPASRFCPGEVETAAAVQSRWPGVGCRHPQWHCALACRVGEDRSQPGRVGGSRRRRAAPGVWRDGLPPPCKKESRVQTKRPSGPLVDLKIYHLDPMSLLQGNIQN